MSSIQGLASMEPTSPISSIRTTKRKLQDAIQTLDVAVTPPPSVSLIERPTPSKRPRSLYSALQKYGINSRQYSNPPPDSTDKIDVSKSAPLLAAILARSASRSKQLLSSKHSSDYPTHSPSEYRPSFAPSFLSRLATYKLTTYANKPPQIDAVAAAKCGWINHGKDRLVCGMCDVSWVLIGREGMNKDAANALVEKQRISLVDMHKDGCPWKTRQCDSSIYRVPLQSPAAMVRELRATALLLEPMVANVVIKHPLTASQLSSFRSVLSTASPEGQTPEDSAMEVDEHPQPTLLSDTAIVTALFGWVPAPPSLPSERRRTSSVSASRPGTYGPSASMPPTPSLSRASSVSQFFRDQESTPTSPASSPRKSISQIQFSASPVRVRTTSRLSLGWPSNISSTGTVRDTSLLHCMLCQRRVGLWGYSTTEAPTSAQEGDSTPVSQQPQKQFDVVKEHRSYCPYIVSGTAVPSFPSSSTSDLSTGTVEGWRAVLTVAQRHGLGQRQRLSRLLPSDSGDSQPRDAELKGVEAMVAGVKSNGGRELLKYVKGLLG